LAIRKGLDDNGPAKDRRSDMALSVIRLGTPRTGRELRIGTVRRPPRGVRKEDFARLGYYDVWLPLLSPSETLVGEWRSAAGDPRAMAGCKKKFRDELKKSGGLNVIALLAALSRRTDISVGCYCEDESACHRSVLRELLAGHGAEFAKAGGEKRRPGGDL